MYTIGMKEVSKKTYYIVSIYYTSVFYIECLILPSEKARRHANEKYKLREYYMRFTCPHGILCLSTPVTDTRNLFLCIHTFRGIVS